MLGSFLSLFKIRRHGYILLTAHHSARGTGSPRHDIAIEIGAIAQPGVRRTHCTPDCTAVCDLDSRWGTCKIRSISVHH